MSELWDNPWGTPPPENGDGTPFRFLDLPPEMRNIIYRHLLIQSTSIDSYSYHCCPEIHTAILYVNHQIHDEARPVLYGENYFGMTLFDNDGEEMEGASYFLCSHFVKEAKWHFPHLQLVQRYDIYIKLHGKDDFEEVKETVRDVCKVLSEMPKLKHLIITFGGKRRDYPNLEAAYLKKELPDKDCGGKFANNPEGLECHLRRREKRLGKEIAKLIKSATILQPFAVLRSVTRVTFHGVVQPRYKAYLTTVMQGNTPVDNLPKMYDTLQHYAGPFAHCKEALLDATQAMEDDDVDAFKAAREFVIKRLVAHMTSAEKHLFDHDARVEKETQSTTARKATGKEGDGEDF